MKNILIILIISLLHTSCDTSNCDKSHCKFNMGDQVTIKNKPKYNKATIVEIDCECNYMISYYTYLDLKRQEYVKEVEIE